MGLFNDRTKFSNNKEGVPVWFMRQAGRYHSHYQSIKLNSDFMTMCKTPQLASEITLGPIQSFNFDAAILFSDLLFPLEQLGLGLSYQSGPPTLEIKLDKNETIKNLKIKEASKTFYLFQKEALLELRQKLKSNISLLGFVGGPLTLYTYACEGSHSGNLISSKQGLYDGRYKNFLEILMPNLLENMLIQAEGNANAICIFDTAAGEFALREYKNFIVPALRDLCTAFKTQKPNCKIVYYSKMTHIEYFKVLDQSFLNEPQIDVLGIDWRMDLPSMLDQFSERYYIQGNLDPSLLHLPWNVLGPILHNWWKELHPLGATKLKKWIAGLGHGVLQFTPEENVFNTVKTIHDHFQY